MTTALWLIVLAGALSIVYGIVTTRSLLAADAGTPRMQEISAASQEQSSGIEQINQTVVQMDQATQQNAALVEEATAAARELQVQAGTLSEAVAVFRQQETREMALA